jgi:hypothetical protein
MMKYLLVLLSSILLSTLGLFYYGIDPCLIPLALSCKEVVEGYNWQGSCCSLIDIPGTGGCRIHVAGGEIVFGCSNLECDPANFCNEEHVTDTTKDACAESIYNPLVQMFGESSDGDDSNSTVPSFFLSMARMCSPTAMPTNKGGLMNPPMSGPMTAMPTNKGKLTNPPVSGITTPALTASLLILATIYTFCFLC